MVFSTYVEVILYGYFRKRQPSSILHVCGGDPMAFRYYIFGVAYSPRMWRWSHSAYRFHLNQKVFSTYVEVILKHGGQKGDKASILHVCGGDPTPWNNLVFGTLYSPRMWRWSWIDVLFLVVFLVFSTYVEVILVVGFWIHVKRRILHVCGGDPAIGRELGLSPKYSPRMWRWSLSFLINNSQPSVFSTYVEVILLRPVGTRSIWCILHVCGGDPSLLCSL